MILTENTQAKSLTGIQRLLEVGLLACGCCALYLMLALVSFDPLDPSWSQSGYDMPVRNMAGAIGAWLADILLFFFGAVAYLVPVAISYLGWVLFQKKPNFFEVDFLALGLRIIGFILLLVSTTALSSMNFADVFVYSSGGLLGDVVSQSMLPYFNFVGSTLLLLCFFCTGVTLLFGVSWLFLIDKTGEYVIFAANLLWQKLAALKSRFSKDSASETDEANLNVAQAQSSSEKQATEEAAEEPKTRLLGTNKLPWQKDEAEQTETKPEAQDAQQSESAKKRLMPSLDAIFGSSESEIPPEQTNKQQAATDSKLAIPPIVETTEQLDIGDRKEPVIGEIDEFKEIAEMDEDTLQTLLPLPEQQTQAKDEVKDKPKKAHIRVSSDQTSYADFMAEQEKIAAEEAERAPLTPLPSFELLDRADKKENPITQEQMDAVARLVEAKLLEYKIKADVVGVYPGPVITMLELDLAPGVKVSAITNLSKDLARSLSTASVRVVEVIPGKPYIGLELPNKNRETVRLSEVIETEAFEKSKSPLTMVLGCDTMGKPVIADLAKMPHVLVAGTTGSGKSVLVNTMILSFLYKATPAELRLIMIDPKMLELAIYEDIPHLLCEVVTDMKDASNALRWCVGEMERRYKLMAAVGVRNLKGFNAKVEENIEAGTPLADPLWKPGDSMAESAPELEKLPSIVVVIDEFADMMMIVGKKVEELIARIAQKARAAGIHLILATQRPSVDVITGLIKANIPTRIGLSVSSKIDSRTILDQQGAESLLGMGDMLYQPSGTNIPTRAHGAFVDDHEVHAVVADWKLRGKPNYIDEVLSGEEEILLPGEQPEMAEGEETDALYDEAVAFVTETRKVSVSSVQRKFRIGYNRAARIVEQMEMAGVVSTAGHNGAREVLAAAPPKLDD
ncbi:DNA translocase FtsK [Catenovulum agarivorans DS-2]|uniref:DNA translocase FtsK n=1 Tax=Catenovulum agarivorans DS-2 TaxID=1328313 RepID=W7QRA0_9ALTE|nr:DNA translocase FtsK [Catenovulum agarivorans]EWH10393.1 DNA translocase FtsK [Catenovulum agarivorans DS-2]